MNRFNGCKWGWSPLPNRLWHVSDVNESLRGTDASLSIACRLGSLRSPLQPSVRFSPLHSPPDPYGSLRSIGFSRVRYAPAYGVQWEVEGREWTDEQMNGRRSSGRNSDARLRERDANKWKAFQIRLLPIKSIQYLFNLNNLLVCYLYSLSQSLVHCKTILAPTLW